MDKYSLDKKYIKKLIIQGEQLLKRKKISSNKKRILKQEIITLNSFLNNDYVVDDETKASDNFIQLKNKVLEKMKKDYKNFGRYLIEWIIALENANILKESNYSNISKLSLEEQEEYTIKNYEHNSLILLKEAKKIFSGNNYNQIQQIDEFGYSGCYYSNLGKLSFLFINPAESPWILNHEITHAIENQLNINAHILYKELGPIYFGMLFNDYLFKKQGYLLQGDYEERIDNVSFCLKSVSSYFKTLLAFSKTNFVVSNNRFKKIILDNYKDDIINDNNLYSYINEEILNGNIEESMKYLFSFIKAIELYFKKSNYKDKFEVIEPYIKSKKFILETPTDYYLYEKYIEENKQKRRKK